MCYREFNIVIVSIMKPNSNGYSLPFVLLISTLLAIFFLYLFQILLYQDFDQKKKISKKKLDYACYSAIQKILAKRDISEFKLEQIEVNDIKVILSNFHYGFYDKLFAEAHNTFDSSLLECTIAEIPSSTFDNAMIFSKPNLRATVAGNTIIKGNILATTDNFTFGHIYGISKTNKNFLTGKIIVKNEIESKAFNDSIITDYLFQSNVNDFDLIINADWELDNSVLDNIDPGYKILVSGNLFISGKLSAPNTFKQLFIKSSGKTLIAENTISNLELSVSSDSSIIVDNNSILENCILISKSDITIKHKTQLKNVQLFSEGNISLENVNAIYPSIAGIYVDLSDSSNMNNKILITDSNFNGTILLIPSLVGFSANHSRITIDKKSNIQGLVYCENDLEFLGKLDGTIYTYKMYYYKEPTEYRNWLVELNVNRENLDENFLIPISFNDSKNYEILREKWIH